jgi:hypothetical protein
MLSTPATPQFESKTEAASAGSKGLGTLARKDDLPIIGSAAERTAHNGSQCLVAGAKGIRTLGPLSGFLCF